MKNKFQLQECIPVGCVPSAAKVVSRWGVSASVHAGIHILSWAWAWTPPMGRPPGPGPGHPLGRQPPPQRPGPRHPSPCEQNDRQVQKHNLAKLRLRTVTRHQCCARKGEKIKVVTFTVCVNIRLPKIYMINKEYN